MPSSSVPYASKPRLRSSWSTADFPEPEMPVMKMSGMTASMTRMQPNHHSCRGKFFAGHDRRHLTERRSDSVIELVDDQRSADEGRAAALNEVSDSQRLRPPLGPVVSEQNAVAGGDAGALYAQDVPLSAVVLICRDGDLRTRKEPRLLSDGDEADAELERHRWTENEASCLDARRFW